MPDSADERDTIGKKMEIEARNTEISVLQEPERNKNMPAISIIRSSRTDKECKKCKHAFPKVSYATQKFPWSLFVLQRW